MYFMEAIKENGLDSENLLQEAFDIYTDDIKEENLPNAASQRWDLINTSELHESET